MALGLHMLSRGGHIVTDYNRLYAAVSLEY